MPAMPYATTVQVDRPLTTARLRLKELAVTAALVCSLVVLWALLHPYQGLILDAQLYAYQALAKLQPALATDLYLQHVSQDHYTIFSWFYAALIDLWGLPATAAALSLFCSVGFFVAAWFAARRLMTRDAAYFSMAMLIVATMGYGAAGIFHICEDFLTARSLAEAMIVGALACQLRGWRVLGLGIAAAALFVHPLMALPGLLLVIFLSLPIRSCIHGALAVVLVALVLAGVGLLVPGAASVITIIDPAWLNVVEERSQFLFLRFWSPTDWEANARPFLCLAFTVLVLQDLRMRHLALAAMLVGAAGLTVAFIAGTTSPVAILLQGQAWRWVWITSFVSVLLLVPAVREAWRDERCGPVCAILLVCAWTFGAGDLALFSALPLLVWWLRARVTPVIARALRWAAVLLVIGLVVWTAANSWTFLSNSLAESGRELAVVQRARIIFGFGVPPLLFVGSIWLAIRSSKSWALPAVMAAMLIAALCVIVPSTLKQVSRTGTTAAMEEFADWRQRIPATSTVFLPAATDVGTFVWFTLGRPNYLATEQSAGVVFSRATAMEVQRRSDVLLPLEDPYWKILTRISLAGGDPKKKPSGLTRPLTAKILVSVCTDRALGFVIAPEDVGFDRVRHDKPGLFKGWNLYDCGRVRALAKPS